MSTFKKITGTVRFTAPGAVEHFVDSIDKYEKLYSRKFAGAQVFTATLTYGEQYKEPLGERLVRLLRRVFDEVAAQADTLAAAVANPTAKAALTLVDLLGSYLKNHAQSKAAKELAVAVREVKAPDVSVEWSNQLREAVQRVRPEGIGGRKWDEISDQDFKRFFDSLAEGAQATAEAFRKPDGKLEVTQLIGWLTPTAGAQGTYKFLVQGAANFESAYLASGARFDILGPDGSQLVTALLDSEVIDEWLSGSEYQDAEISIDSTNELRRAFELHERQRITASSQLVRGRLWSSDGAALGSRQIAIFAPPAFGKVLDECCPEAELKPDDDCCTGSGDGRVVLKAPVALAFAQTDESGYFEFSYVESEDDLAAENALLYVSGAKAAIGVKLVTIERTRSGAADGEMVRHRRFPEPLLLHVDAVLLRGDTTNAESEVDWLSQENACDKCSTAHFGEPHRALEEFEFNLVVRTTDPLVTREVLRLGEPRVDVQPPAEDARLKFRQANPDQYFRVPLDRSRQAVWDDDPIIAQAVTIAHGRLLTIKQVWRADGYSLGDLLYSLPLAPLQKKNIAVIDWDRKESISRSDQQVNVEQIDNFVGRERDISEIVNSAVNESIRARSNSSGRAKSGGFGGFVGSLFGASSKGSSSAGSSSRQDSTRNLAATFLNRLRDNTVQAANAYRSQRVTTIQQVEQSERTSALAETVANRNACHAVTIQYFEVLRHFKVDCELSAVRECLYIPLPIESFDDAKALRWRSALTQYLPALQVEALAACERLVSGWDYPAASYADEVLTNLSGEMEITLDLPLPSELQKGDKYDENVEPPENYAVYRPFRSILAAIFRLESGGRDAYFRGHLAPLIARKLIAGLNFSLVLEGEPDEPLMLDATLVTKYRPGGSHNVSIRMGEKSISDLKIKRSAIKGVRVRSSLAVPPATEFIIRNVLLTYQTEHFSFPLVNRGRLDNSIAAEGLRGNEDIVYLTTPLHQDEKRNPKNEDRMARSALMRHLNEHVEYYHKGIWWLMDPDRRFTLLDGFVAPNSGGRSVASVVENELVGIVGNCLVMPVAPGVRLDYYSDVDSEELGALARTTDTEALLAAYRPLIPNPSSRISVPTKGVFAESVMGSCNACEKIDDSRNWRYWEHALPDEPAQIDTLSLATRAVAPKIEPVPMAGPIINQVQNAVPTAPEPTDLSKVIAALTNPNVFGDRTGLAGTQQQAREALAQSFATTTKFGELAAQSQMQLRELAAKALAAYFGVPSMDNGSSLKNSIGKDAAAGRITKEQAQDSITRVNNAMASTLEPGAGSVLDHPDLADAVGSAGQRGAPLTVKRGDTEVVIGEPSAGVHEDIQSRSGWDSWLPWPLRLFAPSQANAKTGQRSAAAAKIYTITILRPRDPSAEQGRLIFSDGDVSINATCWWARFNRIDSGTYSKCSKTEMDKLRHEAIYVRGAISKTSKKPRIFIHAGKDPSYSLGCIAVESEAFHQLWNHVSPRNGFNINVVVKDE